MYYSTSRVLAILDLLQAHGQMRGEDIAARLEVDARTVRRYVMILRDRGIPVEMKRGRYGGYSLPAGYRQPLALTQEEALALTYGLLSGGQQALGLGDRDATRTLKKVTRVLPSATRELIGALDGAVTFATPQRPADVGATPESLRGIVHAIQRRHRVHIRHRSQAGEVTERAVDPYQVVHRAGRWYLVGYCHLRAEQRVFRLDHVLHVKELDETVAPVPIDAIAAVEQSIARTPWRWEFEVIVDAPADVVRRHIPATAATFHQLDDGTALRGFASDLDWLAYTLAGIGRPLVIVRPQQLRDHFHALAQRMQSIADQPAPPLTEK
jgi:predicted DNA-binding transcriptional regulator YafY